MDSKLDTSLGFLHRLRDEGRRHADIWLERNFRSSNARPSVNLAQFFGGMKAPA